MELRPFGRTGRAVSAIRQGTWELEKEPEAAVEALRRGVDLGLTHIDTAEMYGGGAVEELVGRALAERRHEVFLVSKVLPSNASRAGTIAACEASLRRLGTHYLDCYLLHWPGRIPLAETFAAFDRLQQDGKIRSFGVSNFDVGELEEAARLAGAERLACNQVLYHLGERAIEHAVLPWCAEHGVAVVAYSPFGSGRFPSPSSAGGRVLAEIAARHDASPRQVALAFLLGRPQVFVIPKAATLAHVEANAAAARVRLSDEEVGRLDAAFPRGPLPRTLPTI